MYIANYSYLSVPKYTIGESTQIPNKLENKTFHNVSCIKSVLYYI